MTTAQEIMTTAVACVDEDETVASVARKIADLSVGSMPIRSGEDLIGLITDRDIVVKVIAAGRDPESVTCGDIAQGEAITASVDDDVDEILRTMGDHQVRRLPVTEDDRLVGIVALADVARALPERHVGDLLKAISED